MLSGMPSPSLSAHTVTVTSNVAVSAHWLVEVMYCTVYVPAVEADKSINPSVGCTINPAGVELYVPPGVPVIVTVGSVSTVQ